MINKYFKSKQIFEKAREKSLCYFIAVFALIKYKLYAIFIVSMIQQVYRFMPLTINYELKCDIIA